jgi:ABC-type multidrug transport system fused ATPase/permease subunit
LATIRAYGAEGVFSAKNRELLDWNNRSFYPVIMTQRWLGLRLDLIAAFLIFFASLFAVLARLSVGAEIAGLAISYSLQITGILNWCVRVATDSEQSLVSAERLLAMDDIEKEADEVIPDKRPPNS